MEILKFIFDINVEMLNYCGEICDTDPGQDTG